MVDPADFRVVKCRSHLSFHSESEGGLRQPLTLPTQSIVFKFQDGDHSGSGLVAIVEAEGVATVTAGTVVDAHVTFPDVPQGENFADRTFTLWLGRDIGKAEMTEVESGNGSV